MAKKFFLILSLAVLLHDALGNFEQRSYNPRFRNVNKKYLQQTSSNGEIMEEMYLLDANTQKLTKTDVVLVSLPEDEESSFTENEVADHQNEKHSQHIIASPQRKTQKPNHSAFLEAESGIRQSKPIVLQLLGWTGNPPPPIALPPMPEKNSAVAASEPGMENPSVSIVFKGDNLEEIKPVSSGSLALGQNNKEELSQKPEVVVVKTVENKIVKQEPSTLNEAISQSLLAAGASEDSKKESEIKNDEDLIKIPLVANFKPGMGDLEGTIVIQEDPMEEIEPESSGVLATGSSVLLDQSNKKEPSQKPEVIVVEAAENIMNKEPSALVGAISQPTLVAGASENLEKKQEFLEIPVVAITSKPSDMKHPVFIQADKMEEVKPMSSGLKEPVSMIALGQANKQEFIQKPDAAVVNSDKKNIVNEKPSSLVDALYQAVEEAGASENSNKETGTKNIEKDIVKTAVVNNSKPDISVPIYIREHNMEKIKPVSSGVIASESILAFEGSNKEKLSQKPEEPSTLVEALSQNKVASIASNYSEKVSQVNKVKEDTIALPVKLESVPVMNKPNKPVLEIVENEDKKEVLSGKPAMIQSANLSDKNIDLLVIGMQNGENASPVYQESTVVSAIVPEKVSVMNEQAASPQILKDEAKKEVLEVSKVEKLNSDDKKIESLQNGIVQKLNKVIAGASLISQVAPEKLPIKTEAKPDSAIIPEINIKSKLPSATELKKDTIGAVEQHQKVTIVLPKEEEVKPVISELSPIKGNDKSEVPEKISASSVTVKENAVPENSSPLSKDKYTLESKPVQITVKAPPQAPVISELNTKVEKQSVEILQSPIIVESKLESKIPAAKLPLVTELKKDTIAAVESNSEKHQTVSVVLPKGEEKKPVVLELSPIKGNDKSEVPEKISASSVTVKESAVPENSSPISKDKYTLESKPVEITVKAPLQAQLIPELSTKVQKQSVDILESPIIVESKLESKIPAEKLEPCDKFSSSPVQKETLVQKIELIAAKPEIEVKKTELIAAKPEAEAQKTELNAAKPASEGTISSQEPQSLLENKIKEANKLDTMSEKTEENSSISNRKTKPKPNHHKHKPRPKPRPAKIPTQKPATSTSSPSSSSASSTKKPTAESTPSASTSSTVPDLGS